MLSICQHKQVAHTAQVLRHHTAHLLRHTIDRRCKQDSSYGRKSTLSQQHTAVKHKGVCNLLQKALQNTQLQINPINALYCVMPTSALCLFPLLLFYEGQQLCSAGADLLQEAPLLLTSAIAACLLNVVSFWVVSNTSALTMKLAGIMKDAALIVSSAMLFKTRLTALGAGGYIVAVLSIGVHNYLSLKDSGTPESILKQQSTDVTPEETRFTPEA